MNVFLVAPGQTVLVVIILFFGLFAATSLSEGQGRAFRRSLVSLILISAGVRVFFYGKKPERRQKGWTARLPFRAF